MGELSPISAATIFLFGRRGEPRSSSRPGGPGHDPPPSDDAATHGGFPDSGAPARLTALRTPRRATTFRTTTRRRLAVLRARRRETLLAIRRSRPRATAPRTPPLLALLATRLARRTLRTALRTLLFATRLTVFLIVNPHLFKVQGG